MKEVADPCEINVSLGLSQEVGRLISRVSPRGLSDEQHILGTGSSEHIKEKKPMRIKHLHMGILNDLSISDLLSAPHDESAVEPPLTMHNMEQPVRMLA